MSRKYAKSPGVKSERSTEPKLRRDITEEQLYLNCKKLYF